MTKSFIKQAEEILTDVVPGEYIHGDEYEEFVRQPIKEVQALEQAWISAEDKIEDLKAENAKLRAAQRKPKEALFTALLFLDATGPKVMTADELKEWSTVRYSVLCALQVMDNAALGSDPVEEKPND